MQVWKLGRRGWCTVAGTVTLLMLCDLAHVLLHGDRWSAYAVCSMQRAYAVCPCTVTAVVLTQFALCLQSVFARRMLKCLCGVHCAMCVCSVSLHGGCSDAYALCTVHYVYAKRLSAYEARKCLCMELILEEYENTGLKRKLTKLDIQVRDSAVFEARIGNSAQTELEWNGVWLLQRHVVASVAVIAMMVLQWNILAVTTSCYYECCHDRHGGDATGNSGCHNATVL
eukprot:1161427-Pelagomonas_calceolata.AAC.2